MAGQLMRGLGQAHVVHAFRPSLLRHSQYRILPRLQPSTVTAVSHAVVRYWSVIHKMLLIVPVLQFAGPQHQGNALVLSTPSGTQPMQAVAHKLLNQPPMLL